MARSPIPRSEEEETGRETRLKLVLLAVALDSCRRLRVDW